MRRLTSLLCALCASSLLALSQNPTSSSVSPDGNLQINGQEVLPVGFYAENLPLAQIDQPAILSSGGFNLIFKESNRHPVSEFATFLPACAASGIDVVIGTPYAFQFAQDSNGYRYLVDTLSSYPAVAVVNMLDDANNFTAADLAFQRYIYDPVSPTLAKSASFYLADGAMSAQLPDLEVAYMQLYSWDDDGIYGNPLDLSGDFDKMSGLVQGALANGVVPIATPQAFNWRGGGTIPPPGHLDAQSYLSIVAGAKGLLFYTLRDYMGVDPIAATQQGQAPVTIDVTQPRLYAEATNLAAELVDTELSRAILAGTRATVELSPYTYYATFTDVAQEYLVAVNVDYTRALRFDIPLPASAADIAPAFPSRADPLTVSGGVATGTLQPLEAVVYRLTSAPVPAELVRFGAERSMADGAEVTVTWKTATEQDVAYFAVEYGPDGEAFAELTRVTPTGSGSAYAVTHALGAAQSGYYRLRTVDEDGTASLSRVEAVEPAGAARVAPLLQVYPNPVRATLRLAEWPAGAREYVITSAMGQAVATGVIEGAARPVPTELDVSGLAAGVYYLSVRGGSGVAPARFVRAD